MTIRTLRSSGFTLLELIVTVAIVSILIALATPSVLTYQRNAELTSLANSLISSINAARGEAMKRGRYAMVTPIDGVNWSSGWRVFVDVNASRVFESTSDLVVYTSDVPSANISISPNGTAAAVPPYIMFDASGYAKAKDLTFGNLTMSIARTDVSASEAAAQTRRLVIAKTGRARVCKPATDSNCTTGVTD